MKLFRLVRGEIQRVSTYVACKLLLFVQSSTCEAVCYLINIHIVALLSLEMPFIFTAEQYLLCPSHLLILINLLNSPFTHKPKKQLE